MVMRMPKIPTHGIENSKVVNRQAVALEIPILKKYRNICLIISGSMIFRLMQVRQLQVCLIKFANYESLPNQVRFIKFAKVRLGYKL